MCLLIYLFMYVFIHLYSARKKTRGYFFVFFIGEYDCFVMNGCLIAWLGVAIASLPPAGKGSRAENFAQSPTFHKFGPACRQWPASAG